ncbi:MAG: hypothetical protein JSR99_15445 [Proteobacteria bacterium]|nr:hypothetical protein [Pseudomonadota bacterium]
MPHSPSERDWFWKAAAAAGSFVFLIIAVAVVESIIHWYVFGTVHEDEAFQEQVVAALDTFDPLQFASTLTLVTNPKLPLDKQPAYQLCLDSSRLIVPAHRDCAHDDLKCIATQVPHKDYDGCAAKAAKVWPSAPYVGNVLQIVPTAFWRTLVYERETFSQAQRVIIVAQLIIGAVLSWIVFKWLLGTGGIRGIGWLTVPAFFVAGTIIFATLTAYPLAYVAKLTLKPLWALYAVVTAHVIHAIGHVVTGQHAG